MLRVQDLIVECVHCACSRYCIPGAVITCIFLTVFGWRNGDGCWSIPFLLISEYRMLENRINSGGEEIKRHGCKC